MKIKYIGIDIDKDTIIETYYKSPQDRRCIKLCAETNFNTGLVAYEDGAFLPEGTYVVLKEKGEEDKIGRIFHYYIGCHQENNYKTAIVDVHYDMDSSKNRLRMNDKLIIGFINKSMAGINCNKNKFLQVVSYEETEDDKWEFVRVEYGSPNVKMFYMYGWQYYDGKIYSKKDLSSDKISCLANNYKVINVYKEVYSVDKCTNVEYKIPPTTKFVPYEIELIVVYILLMCVASIFKCGVALWIIFTIIFIIIRNNLRSEYNG